MTALILDIARTDREASDDEIRTIRAEVAAAGFDPSAVSRVGLVAHGVRWAGRIVRSDDRLGTGVAHYLRHVVAGQEWPAGTTFEMYAGIAHLTSSQKTDGRWLRQPS
ncbi:MAG: hypothetical protein ACRDJE_07630 [Dehalococcoidia bacterium]